MSDDKDPDAASAKAGRSTGEDKAGEVIPLIRKKRKCPNCGNPGAAEYRPFCSKRCADIDLGRWLKGGYRIPGEPAPRDDEEEVLD